MEMTWKSLTCISNLIYSCASRVKEWARLRFPFHVRRLQGEELSSSRFPTGVKRRLIRRNLKSDEKVSDGFETCGYYD